MCMEQWWNDTDRETEVLGEKSLHLGWQIIELLWSNFETILRVECDVLRTVINLYFLLYALLI